MAVLDTKIYQWKSGSPNAPSDASTIGTDLAAQIRNIKSVYRILSFNKLYEDHDFELTNAPFDAQGSYRVVIFNVNGNVLAQFERGRKVVALDPASGSLVGGVVVGTNYSSSAKATTVTAAFWRESWTTNHTVLYLGTDNNLPKAFPLSSVGGSAGIRGSASSFVVDFSTKQNTATTFAGAADTFVSNETKLYMPTKDYMVHLSCCYKDPNITNENSSLIKSVTKDFNQFTVNVFESPGTVDSVKMEIFFDWSITMPRYYS